MDALTRGPVMSSHVRVFCRSYRTRKATHHCLLRPPPLGPWTRPPSCSLLLIYYSRQSLHKLLIAPESSPQQETRRALINSFFLSFFFLFFSSSAVAHTGSINCFWPLIHVCQNPAGVCCKPQIRPDRKLKAEARWKRICNLLCG